MKEPEKNADYNKLTKTTKSRCFDVMMDFDKNPEHKQIGIRTELSETIRTYKRHNYLRKNGKTKTKYSNHLPDFQGRASAFDLALVKTFKGHIQRFFWGKEKWEMELVKFLSQIGVMNRLRNLGQSYDWDYWHFELPRVVQEDRDCYAYAIINALQYHRSWWRERTHDECIEAAELIQANMGKGKGIVKALLSAKQIGFIKGYEKFKFKVLEDFWALNGHCAVLSQKWAYGLPEDKRERWKAIIKRVLDGLGIPHHAGAFMYADKEGVNVLNSHRPIPEYCITDVTQIQTAYRIIVDNP